MSLIFNNKVFIINYKQKIQILNMIQANLTI